MIAASAPDHSGDGDGAELAARARQLGTEHGQAAGDTFVIPGPALARHVLAILESDNLTIDYRVSKGVETSPQRMCEGLGVTMQDSRMSELWVEYGTSYNEAANTAVRRRAEAMVA